MTPADTIGLVVETAPGPGVLHELTGVMARHGADITLVEILENRPDGSRIYFEARTAVADALERDLAALPVVTRVAVVKTFQRIYGKRIIIMGGGAQVGQVALGAISEADRHNIRGEHISVDTIPLVGEQSLAEAVRAVARLPRARALVLAGALMGGDMIEHASEKLRLARRIPDRVGAESGHGEEAVEPFGLGGDEAERRDRQRRGGFLRQLFARAAIPRPAAIHGRDLRAERPIASGRAAFR